MKEFVTTARRLPSCLNQTFAAVIPGWRVVWIGFFLPSKTPRDVIDVLHAAVVQAHSASRCGDTFAKAACRYGHARPRNISLFGRDEIERAAHPKENKT